jgi:hypothetical protein
MSSLIKACPKTYKVLFGFFQINSLHKNLIGLQTLQYFKGFKMAVKNPTSFKILLAYG